MVTEHTFAKVSATVIIVNSRAKTPTYKHEKPLLKII